MLPKSETRNKGSIETRYKHLIGLMLISPWIIGLVVFKLVPILDSHSKYY